MKDKPILQIVEGTAKVTLVIKLQDSIVIRLLEVARSKERTLDEELESILTNDLW